ncbi:MAG: HIT family protein [Acidimicrobiales bacterium]|nr:HIT family protein [Acidimicrobiales bacterium]
MSSVFTKIINGSLPGHFLWKDNTCVSFLSINPISQGHALIVPEMEIDHWLDLPPEVNKHLIEIGQIIGLAQMTVYEPLRVGMVIAGLEVPHTHLHVIPMDGMKDLDFSNASTSVDNNELAKNAAMLRNAIKSRGHGCGV